MNLKQRYWPGRAPAKEVVEDSSEEEEEVVEETIEPETISTIKQDLIEQDNEEEAEIQRRRLIKERALLKRQEAQVEAAPIVSSSEYTSESESEPEPSAPLLKPVFISKADREALAERKRLETLKNSKEEKQRLLLERRQESHKLVEDELRREMATVDVTAAVQEVDDTDGLNEEEETAAWRLRELSRIRRDKDEQIAREKEIADIERRRKMTDEEVVIENERINPKKEKETLAFLQRYYHKGAFFADDESDVMRKDYSAPTLDDTFNKQLLPEVMQVKKFGKAGQTKWTHLSKEDTSNKEAGWSNPQEVFSIPSRLDPSKESFSKPTKKRKL